MSSREVRIFDRSVQTSQVVLFALIVVVYGIALFALPPIVEPVILGLPLWAWIAIVLTLVHYILVYKFIQDYRDLDQVVPDDG